jgi:NAD-dependent dihydropyrimidine dehydrogenase PreA subunit
MVGGIVAKTYLKGKTAFIDEHPCEVCGLCKIVCRMGVISIKTGVARESGIPE